MVALQFTVAPRRWYHAEALAWAAATENLDALLVMWQGASAAKIDATRGYGATVDLAKWRDRDSTFIGYVEELPSVAGASYTDRPSVIARLSHDVVAKALPYPVAPVYVIVLSDSAIAADRIARLSAPPLDEGPHLSYAFQWFAFATVALVGVGIVLRQSRSSA